MKKVITTQIIIIISFLTIHGQKFQENYLGDDFLQYKGVILKLKSNPSSNFSHKFYSDLKYCQSEYDNNVIYPDKRYSFSTVKDSLANRIFKVENIIGKDGVPIKTPSFFNKPIFVLRDTSNQQVIYFKYDTQYEHNFPFITSKIEFDLNILCSNISRKVDDFTDEITLNSPFVDGRKISSMIIYKRIQNGNITYNLSIRTIGSTVNVGESGVIILFEDGTKINKPEEEIDVDSDENGFEYSAFITLSQSDLQTLKTKNIRKYRLYIYDEEINPGEANKFKAYVNCIVEQK